MKKRFIFLLLFSVLFTFFAAAEEVNYSSFGDADEACTEGYRNGLYDEYQYNAGELLDSEAENHVEIIEYLIENFDSGMDPEEYDPEMIAQAYEYGYMLGMREYQIVLHTTLAIHDTIYQQGYNAASAKSIIESHENTNLENDRYYEGYEEGYNAGVNEISRTLSYRIGSAVSNIFLYFAFMFLLIIPPALLKFFRSRKNK